MGDVTVEIVGFLYESGEILSKKDTQAIGAGHYELMADRGFDGGFEKLVRLKDYDAALAREAALREELANRKRKHLRSCQIAIGKSQLAKERYADLIELGAECSGLHKRLTAAEQRNAEMLDILGTINCLGVVRLMDEGLQRRIKTIVHQLQREKIAAALKPTESGASE